MTITLRIEDNSITAKQLAWIKEHVGIRVNTNAIERAIAYYSNYENHLESIEENCQIISELRTEIRQYKQAIKLFTKSVEVMKQLSLTE